MAVTGQGISHFKCTAQSDSVALRMKIKSIRWVGTSGTTANEVAVVTDLGGNEIFRSIADGAAFIDIIPLYKWVDGFIVSALTTGAIFVNVE